MSDQSPVFVAIAERAEAIGASESELNAEPLDALESTAAEFERSWSHSNLGYQANVYYRGFRQPPPGHMFSREWGFLGMFQGTTGTWDTHNADEVQALVERQAGNPDTSAARTRSDQVRVEVEELIEQARSAAAKINSQVDDYVKSNVEELQKIKLPTLQMLTRVQMQGVTGQIVSRDAQAIDGGIQVAGHQIVVANVHYIKSPFWVARELAKVCGRLGRHLEGELSTQQAIVQFGSKVFIGHGGSSDEYLKLGVWLTDRDLEWDVYDRAPTAGLSHKERLQEMLDSAKIAFLLMTAEDETADGKRKARDNVVHEVGLFQGRLGWTRAIVLLEDGCEEFSNIEGIGQIRFPAGNLSAAFDEIRSVLVREGVLSNL